ncbi:hypothetical protein K8R20_01985 [bacterium]|nr:hypothetical protein [bacterium]
MNYLNELEQLNLPLGEFAIFGSGPMAVRGIRESNDIDIIVKQDLWDNLVKKYPTSLHDNPDCLEIGNIEIMKCWLDSNIDFNIDEMIDNAEILGDFPYVQLKYVVKYKKQSMREKDLSDLKLIEKYNNNQGKSS